MTIYQIADDLLDQAQDLLAAPPDRRYVTWGDIAWDCDQLVAQIGAPRTSRGLTRPGGEPIICMTVPVWTVCLELVRCVPTQEDESLIPTADLSAAAQTFALDVEDLFYGLLLAAANETLLPEGCSNVTLTTQTVGPTGGMVGFRACIQFESSRPQGVGAGS